MLYSSCLTYLHIPWQTECKYVKKELYRTRRKTFKKKRKHMAYYSYSWPHTLSMCVCVERASTWNIKTDILFIAALRWIIHGRQKVIILFAQLSGIYLDTCAIVILFVHNVNLNVENLGTRIPRYIFCEISYFFNELKDTCSGDLKQVAWRCSISIHHYHHWPMWKRIKILCFLWMIYF